MFAYIRGVLKQITDEAVIIDVGGVGYEIVCANPFVYQHKENTEVLIHTYHHVREDAQILYGFETTEQKDLFIQLISVSGIGPKSGINILGQVNVADFVAAIESEDEKYLMQFPGVGKKTSRQIILDLKGKLTQFSAATGGNENQTKSQAGATVISETKEALKSLGYTEQEIRSIVPKLQASDAQTVDELIPQALSLLVKS
ncbi:MAG TPA: Holliday junction branch migration protein RuvA [Bacillota bacterium]|nr:Holliday junction branch migration protein RuvA [Bacillota bacterium]